MCRIDHVNSPLVLVALTILISASIGLRAAGGGQEIPFFPEAGAPKADTSATEDADAEATVGEAVGPIAVARTVSDEEVQALLDRLLPRYPGVRSVEIQVEDGVVTLTGHVENEVIRDRVRDFARRVEGVNLVLNRTQTDAQVLTARQLLVKRLNTYGNIVGRNWLLVLVALAALIASVLLARLFTRFSDRILSLFLESVLLRSVVGSIIAASIMLLGVFSALEILGVAQAVLSVVGLAGVAALAISFAFRDIAENFISSILLGVRRPFHVGDFVEVAGHSGVVRALNTRATILVTLEGHQVRIPNATVFKNVIINRTAADSVQESFDVVVGYDVSATTAQRAIASALREHDGLLPNPPPRTLVEALESGGVRLRSTFWVPVRGLDTAKLLSDLQLKAKVALQQAGITPAPAAMALSLADRITVALASTDGSEVPAAEADAAIRTRAERVRESLRNDSEAASHASSRSEDAQPDAIEHALHVTRDLGNDEGGNLLNEKGQ